MKRRQNEGRHQRCYGWLLLITWIFATCPQAQAGVVEDWNKAFFNAVRKETPPPCLVARNFAIFHLAMYEAAKEADARCAGFPNVTCALGEEGTNQTQFVQASLAGTDEAAI